MEDCELVEDPTEVLRRQVVPGWIGSDGAPMSVAFIPMPKDELRLSTDRERATPERSFKRYVENGGQVPAGTWGIRVEAILNAHAAVKEEHRESSRLRVEDDAGQGNNHEDHASVVFPELNTSGNQLKRVHERLGKELKQSALTVGKLYPASDEHTPANQ